MVEANIDPNITLILNACYKHGIGLVRQRAYVLATVEHETAGTMQPIHEKGGHDYFESRYGVGSRLAKSLGNTRIGDGALFHGRGFVQLTGRRNYAKFSKILGLDLVKKPDIALDPTTAADILAYGLKNGTFTGKKIQDYITASACDYVGARRCINGTDRAQTIAHLATRWEKRLTDGWG